MTSIDYFVHGRGRGHASRALGVLRKLERHGYRVRIHGGGDATDLLGDLPSFISKAPILPGPSAPGRLVRESLAEYARLRRTRPGALITDGDQSALAGARALEIPTIAVGHDLAIGACRIGDHLPLLRLYHQRINCALPRLLADRLVAVHFLPVRASRPGVIVARPQPETTAVPVRDDGFVLAYFRDDNGAAAVEYARSEGAEVIRFGGRGGNGHAPSRQRFVGRLARASAVVASAGSNLLAECVLMQKPVLALYKERDHEQALNALIAERAGVAMACAFERLRRRDVHAFLDRVKSRDFATIDLKGALPPVHEAVFQALTELIGDRSSS